MNRRPGGAETGTGGFLAGAAQTALGVAGGWLLGSAIAGMFGGGILMASLQHSGAEPSPLFLFGGIGLMVLVIFAVILPMNVLLMSALLRAELTEDFGKALQLGKIWNFACRTWKDFVVVYIVVTPVFSASYSGLFKTFFDVLDTDTLAGVPVLIAATAGTARHSLVLEHALRPLFSYLHATVVPTGVFAATDDFGDSGLDARIDRAAGELAALLSGTPRQKARTLEDEFADPTPFEDLLRGA